jgi:hypothetical protein
MTKCCNKKQIKQYDNGLYCSNCLIKHEKEDLPFKLIFLFFLLFFTKSFGIMMINNNKTTYGINKTNIIDYYKVNPLIIEIIESGGNSKVVSFKSAVGIMQITQPCLDDYNKAFKTKYSLNDMFNIYLNKKVSIWYLKKRIPELLKKSKIKISLINVLICYNAGIQNCIIYNKTGKLPQETKDYLIKYLKNV